MRVGSFFMLLSFINVQLFALIIGWLFVIMQVTVTENPADIGNSASFFITILIAAAAILLVLKYYKGKMLFLLLELALIFISFSIFFGLFPIGDWALSGGAIAVILRLLFPAYRNIYLLFASGIVGALLGASLDIVPAAILAMLLAVYDVIAVFYTKHMVTLAKELHEREAGFSITFPMDFKAQVVVPKDQTEKMKKLYKVVRKEAVELGTGDLAIPAMLVASALHVPGFMVPTFWHAMFTMLGATFGMTLLFYFIEKKKGYWPALPPIVFFALLALVLYHFGPIKLG
ncbi:MAG: presenilin family intramembrane aspartyl protease [Candidatus Micrarchaeota archaeon]